MKSLLKILMFSFLWFNSKIEQSTADLILASFDNSTILMTSNTDLIQYPLSVDHFSDDALDNLAKENCTCIPGFKFLESQCVPTRTV